MRDYAIITPAHNEARLIPRTIDSVRNQTVRPAAWIIVDDASSDGTADVAATAIADLTFAHVVRVTRPPGRHFGNKVNAFNRGLAALPGVQYAYLGNLDADISLPARYYETVLDRFRDEPELGIGGGMVASQIGGRFVRQEVALDSVAGAVQLFRRECFESIGGYVPMPLGGVDTATEIKARMRGWRVRTFPDLEVREHRQTGSATAGPIASRYKEGRRLRGIGYSAMFFALRCAFRWRETPAVTGSIAALCGFVVSTLKREPLVMPPAEVRFLRAEQRAKVRRLLARSS